MKNAEKIECLIIDDDDDDFFIADDALSDITSRPHVATWASSYEKAEELIASQDFDVCLVDYRIGARTGLDFVKEAIAKGVRIPMILLTGISAGQEIDEEASESGAFDFIEKSEITSQFLERSIRYSIAQAQQLRKLEENTTLLRATLEHTGAGIAAFNKDRELETINSRLTKILGIAAPGNADDGYTTPDVELAALVIEKLQVFEVEADQSREIEVADGRTIEVRNNLAPDGRRVIVCSDVTDRKRNELELIASREAAISANEAKSRFLANMSHELRTPLHAIIGFTEVVQAHLKQSNADGSLLDHTDEVVSSGRNLLNLINDILTLSKLDYGDIDMHNEWIEVRELTGFCRNKFEDTLATKNQRLTEDICSDEIFVNCDGNIIKDALFNLVSNATKFTDENGTIGLEVECSDSGELCLSVSDNGIGMTEDEKSECMQLFRQADNSLARKYEGTGLGLPLVQRYIELHDGWLNIETEKDVGTRVTVVLPTSRVRISGDGISGGGEEPKMVSNA